MHDLPLLVAEMPIGRMAAITVWRGNVALSLRPVIAEMPVNPAVAELGRERPGNERSGAGFVAPLPVSALSPAI